MNPQEPDTNPTPTPEYTIDLSNLPTSTHQWVKRGAIVSCEGAGHPNHQHYLVRRPAPVE